MEFEEWWEQNWSEFPQLHFAHEAWDAAIDAERQRCREIVVKYADRLRNEGYRILDTIADEIGE